MDSQIAPVTEHNGIRILPFSIITHRASRVLIGKVIVFGGYPFHLY